MKKILVIQGHTDKTSLIYALANSYYEHQKSSGCEVDMIDLALINFDPTLKMGYKEIMPLEESLQTCQHLIKDADHIVVFYPTWWGTLPAKLKGFFDRVLLPGFAFKFEEGKMLQTKLLSGKTATIVTTMDTPPFFYKYLQGNLGIKLLKNLILGFCGIKTKKVVLVGPVRSFDEKKRGTWIEKVKAL